MEAYEDLEMEIITFETEDVITGSPYDSGTETPEIPIGGGN